MTRRFFQILALFTALAVFARAHASTPDVSACWNAQTEAKGLIAACTVAIRTAGGDKVMLATAYQNRALGYMRVKAFDKGLKDCETAIGLQPGNARGFICRGIMHGELNKLDLAVADFDRALRLHPDDVDALRNRAYAFEMKNDFVSAAANYDVLIRLQPANAQFRDGRCWARAVIGKQLAAAMSDCNESLRLDPGNANDYNSRGFVHFRMKQYAEAIRDYDAAVAIDAKTYGSSYYVRGLAKLAMGNASGAVDIAKGKVIEPGIAKRYAGYGVSSKHP